jgi:hypothetical protein
MRSCKVEQDRIVNALHLRKHLFDFEFRRNVQSIILKDKELGSNQINGTDYLDEFQDSAG